MSILIGEEEATSVDAGPRQPSGRKGLFGLFRRTKSKDEVEESKTVPGATGGVLVERDVAQQASEAQTAADTTAEVSHKPEPSGDKQGVVTSTEEPDPSIAAEEGEATSIIAGSNQPPRKKGLFGSLRRSKSKDEPAVENDNRSVEATDIEEGKSVPGIAGGVLVEHDVAQQASDSSKCG